MNSPAETARVRDTIDARVLERGDVLARHLVGPLESHHDQVGLVRRYSVGSIAFVDDLKLIAELNKCYPDNFKSSFIDNLASSDER